MQPDALFVEMDVLIKAEMPEDGRRLISLEASNEHQDSEGDVVLQKALLNSAPSFLARGCVDWGHLSEIGHNYGLNTADFILGKPLKVNDLGEGRTGVIAELNHCAKSTEIWEGLQLSPPEVFSASIYGLNVPGGLISARTAKCAEAPAATRFVVKALDWRSLAITRKPINTSIRHTARVVTPDELLKSHILKGLLPSLDGVAPPPFNYSPSLPTPRNRLELLAHYALHMDKGECPCAGPGTALGRSVAGFREHFYQCSMMPADDADIYALALMQLLKRA